MKYIRLRTPDQELKNKKIYIVDISDAEGNITRYERDCYSVMSVSNWALFCLIPKGGRIVGVYEEGYKT